MRDTGLAGGEKRSCRGNREEDGKKNGNELHLAVLTPTLAEAATE